MSTKAFLTKKNVEAIKFYKNINGDTLIPSGFIVPKDNVWPVTFSGLKLGQIVRQLRDSYKDKKLSKDLVDNLCSENFIWDVREYNWKQIVSPALHLYKKFNGHLLVPSNFIIPPHHPWIPKMHGYPLGKVVLNIRSSKVYVKGHPDRIEELDSIGFAWNHYDQVFYYKIIPALIIFKKIYGNLFIHCEFVVPDALPWPKQCWNLKLGEVVRKIRSNKTYLCKDKDKKTELDKLGFIWDYHESQFNLIILPTLQMYKKIYGNLRIPPDFSVPWQHPWPELSWDLRIGAILTNIRLRGDYISRNIARQKVLEELGVVFPSKDL